jgi:hypothetical protein
MAVEEILYIYIYIYIEYAQASQACKGLLTFMYGQIKPKARSMTLPD